MTSTWLRAGTMVVAVLLLGGCPNARDDSPRERISVAEAARLADELDALPGVGDADVRYANTASNNGDVTVLLPLEPEADGATVAEAAARAVWTSRIDPLGSIEVSASDPTDPSRNAREELSVQRDSAELLRRFGPRPEGVEDGS